MQLWLKLAAADSGLNYTNVSTQDVKVCNEFEQQSVSDGLANTVISVYYYTVFTL